MSILKITAIEISDSKRPLAVNGKADPSGKMSRKAVLTLVAPSFTMEEDPFNPGGPKVPVLGRSTQVIENIQLDPYISRKGKVEAPHDYAAATVGSVVKGYIETFGKADGIVPYTAEDSAGVSITRTTTRKCFLQNDEPTDEQVAKVVDEFNEYMFDNQRQTVEVI